MKILHLISPICVSYVQRLAYIAYIKDFEYRRYGDRMMRASFITHIKHIKRK